jgi:hypothetical protein
VRLLACRDELLKLEESVAKSDVQSDSELAAFDAARIYSKSDPRWLPLYQALKAELTRREHIQR